MNKFIVLLSVAALSVAGHLAEAQESSDSAPTSASAAANGAANETALQNDNAKQAPLQVANSVIQLETSAVKGSQELPKVLVIVPWKTAEVVDNEDRPLASLVEEVLSPLDPAVFRRQTNYYNSLQQPIDEKAPAE